MQKDSVFAGKVYCTTFSLNHKGDMTAYLHGKCNAPNTVHLIANACVLYIIYTYVWIQKPNECIIANLKSFVSTRRLHTLPWLLRRNVCLLSDFITIYLPVQWRTHSLHCRNSKCTVDTMSIHIYPIRLHTRSAVVIKKECMFVVWFHYYLSTSTMKNTFPSL